MDKLINQDINLKKSPWLLISLTFKLNKNKELEKKIDCDFLGNDATSIDYVFTIMLLFCVLILIIFIVYIYVQFKIKKTKK